MQLNYSNIVSAQVINIQPHPNADRLRLVTLKLNDRIIAPVVCGAWNFNIGDQVPLALPGAVIPHSLHSKNHESFILQTTLIRGIESQGMICSGFELGVTTTPDRGVLILHPTTPLGTTFEPSMVNEHLIAYDFSPDLELENQAKKSLTSRHDFESLRIQRMLNLPDLSRTPDSPLKDLVQKIVNLPNFSSFDVIQVPEIVPADISFDLFDFAANHPARSKSDTYYLSDKDILRTHTTVMWHYYLNQPEIKQLISQGKSVGSLCYGKVYRKDEIDRKHMNIFHQMDGWYLCKKTEKIITTQDLQDILIIIAQAVFGANVQYRFNPDTFPYTDPSLEMEIEMNGSWVEVLGAGVVKGSVLAKLGVNPEDYNGWAFGFGLERLAILSMQLPDIRLLWSNDPRIKKQLKLGHKFIEVSKFPPIIRDISFIVDQQFIPNNYFDLIREIGGNLVEEVELLDKYENSEKFGPNKLSYTYRITYRSSERTLTAEEIEPLHHKLEQETRSQFKAEIR